MSFEVKSSPLSCSRPCSSEYSFHSLFKLDRHLASPSTLSLPTLFSMDASSTVCLPPPWHTLTIHPSTQIYSHSPPLHPSLLSLFAAPPKSTLTLHRSIPSHPTLTLHSSTPQLILTPSLHRRALSPTRPLRVLICQFVPISLNKYKFSCSKYYLTEMAPKYM
jgi:hypothetical protein